MILNNLNDISQKNNQISVPDADQEIQTLGSTDHAEKIAKPRFRHHPFTLGLGFFGLHRRRPPMVDSCFFLARVSATIRRTILSDCTPSLISENPSLGN